MASIGSGAGKIIAKQTGLFLCDMQTKFRPSIKYFDQIVYNSHRLLQAVTLLKLPVIVTEQYPQGLGKTVEELQLEKYQIEAVPKTKFSMCIDPVFSKLKNYSDVNTILLCGIETHVCIQQTALDLKNSGFNVFIIADACSSRGNVERSMAFSLLKQAGCWLTTTESAILALAGGSDHSQFKELQKIIKTEGPDTGLYNLSF